jgi:hypothetical protein
MTTSSLALLEFGATNWIPARRRVAGAGLHQLETRIRGAARERQAEREPADNSR